MEAKFLAIATIVSVLSLGTGCDSSSTDNDLPGDQPCEDCGDSQEAPPVVTSVYPPVFYSGAEVKVSGSYLDQTTVAVNGELVIPIVQRAHELHFLAPELPTGSYQLDIENAFGDDLREVAYQDVFSASSVSSGSRYSCAIHAEGTVWCWGANRSGQLGDGSTTDASVPVAVGGLNEAVAVSAGGDGFVGSHTCAVTSDGRVQCWGSNRSGQLGDGSKTDALTPVTVSGSIGAISVSAGGSHTCAVTSDGRVQCWGANSSGQLGDDSTTDASMPVTVVGLLDAVAVSAGESHTCAVMRDGTVRCWGSNSYGQLGDGNGGPSPFPSLEPAEPSMSLTPVTVSGLSDAVSVSAGESHTCAVTGDGRVLCWGANGEGELGDGKGGFDGYGFVLIPKFSLTPVTVSGLSNAVSVSASYSSYSYAGGDAYTCAVTRDGDAQCWGSNRSGQLGDGSTTAALTPVTVSGVSDAMTVSAGGGYIVGSHTCAVMRDGHVQCWGSNSSGQLGDGSTANALTPVTVSGLSDALSFSAGAYHNCAVTSDGIVQCWGSNDSGRLGDGSTTDALTPVTVSGLSGAVVASAGYSHTCAVTSDGRVQCWGYNGSGQLGDGSGPSAPRLTPVVVSGLSNALSVSSGADHTCAVTGDGHVQCWGSNSSGQLGDGSATDALTPVTVSGLSGAVVVSAGYSHTCAVTSDGRVQCWGSNRRGQQGDDSTTDALTPVTVSGVSDAVAVSAGYSHTCAVTSDGRVQCWGANINGQLGDGSTTDALTPVTVSGLSDAVAVSAGDSHTCAVTSDDRVQCWGRNGHGQLGDGSTTDALTPVTVSGLSDAVAVSAGDSHTCALYRDGAVSCWGDSQFGQAGWPVWKHGVGGVVLKH